MEGLEPPISWPQTRRLGQTRLHPDVPDEPPRCSSGRASQGTRTPNRLLKRELLSPVELRTHGARERVRTSNLLVLSQTPLPCLGYTCMLRSYSWPVSYVETTGLEPAQASLQGRCSATRSSVPKDTAGALPLSYSGGQAPRGWIRTSDLRPRPGERNRTSLLSLVLYRHRGHLGASPGCGPVGPGASSGRSVLDYSARRGVFGTVDMACTLPYSVLTPEVQSV